MNPSYTPTDDEAAAAIAVARRRNTLNGGQTNLPGGETADIPERLTQHYVACLSEIAISRLTNLCWTGCGRGADGLKDVGDKWQVRSITDRSRGLLVRGKDDDEDWAVLVFVDTGTRTCEALGWETVREVKRRGRVLDPSSTNPCWILEPSSLLRFG